MIANLTFSAKLSLVLAVLWLGLNSNSSATQLDKSDQSLQLTLRSRVETESDSGNFHAIEKPETWSPAETAIIVCDMWDLHHCHNAVIRVGQLAPPMEKVLNESRVRGVTIIHAPSGCVNFYRDHPARKRATSIPPADKFPESIGDWCSKISEEDHGTYPIDQTDGGEDDEPSDHEAWAKELAERGLNPQAPWSRQTDAILIDDEKDFISDDGHEIWSILQNRKIKNVVLVGVHTNMCVLGRPFGLRQMAKNGKNVALMRDLTDSMYNPAAKPFVSHFSGTDLIVEHIEKFVCPTITSDQIVGGQPFRFPADNRKHIAIVMAEDEYATDKSLPKFAAEHLQKDFRVSLIFGSKQERNDIPGLAAIQDVDVLLVSIRRRTLPEDQLQRFRDFAATTKPMIGIRTASHAFCLRTEAPPAGLVEWPEFDAEVWGGNYTGHTKNGTTYRLVQAIGTGEHPIRKNVDDQKIIGHMSMYLNSPLADSTTCLWRGVAEGEGVHQPVAWLNRRASGGVSFYTSLGHVDDFKQPEFQKLLLNAITALVEAK